MKYVFASRTGNVETIVNELGLDALRIETGDEVIGDDYILFTYTDGYGDIPAEVEAFLGNNFEHLKGVVVSGDTGYGDAFGGAGDKIAEQYGVELLKKVENAGTPEDIEDLKAILAKY